jgi:hypothetical protein
MKFYIHKMASIIPHRNRIMVGLERTGKQGFIQSSGATNNGKYQDGSCPSLEQSVNAENNTTAA